MKAVRVHKHGGPEVLTIEEIPIPDPKAGEARLRIEAIGLNFIDIYQRTGLYPLTTPFTLGMEAAGVVDAVGDAVTEVKKGDRVAYAMIPGAYAEYAVVPAARLAPVPAGGVGLLLVQVAKMRGAKVIGTVSSEAKAELARQAGADQVIVYTDKDFLAEVRRLTGGQGVHVVYDSVGATTFEKSLDCLCPRGYLVLFGQSSGPVPPLEPAKLAAKGSLYLTRPSLNHYTLTRDELLQRAGDVFDWTAAGKLKLRIDQAFPLSEAAEAQRQMEGRRTTGKVLLFP
jgi:NADPH2:quinone reductase